MKKIFLTFAFIFCMIILTISQLFAKTVDDVDKEAFITKSEFQTVIDAFDEKLKNLFSNIDFDIDTTVSQYLANYPIDKVAPEYVYIGDGSVESGILNEEDLELLLKNEFNGFLVGQESKSKYILKRDSIDNDNKYIYKSANVIDKNATQMIMYECLLDTDTRIWNLKGWKRDLVPFPSEKDDVNNILTISKTDSEEQIKWQGEVIIGEIITFAGDSETAPYGFLLCDGATYDKNVYKDLFDAIGYTFSESKIGNDFNVPNLIGNYIRLDEFSEIGKTGGSSEHTLFLEEMPKHTHKITLSADDGKGNKDQTTSNGAHDHDLNRRWRSTSNTAGSKKTTINGTNGILERVSEAGSHTHEYTIDAIVGNVGEGQAFNIEPKYMTMVPYIRYKY